MIAYLLFFDKNYILISCKKQKMNLGQNDEVKERKNQGNKSEREPGKCSCKKEEGGTYMKKQLSLVVAVVLALAMVSLSCGLRQSGEETPPAHPLQRTTPSPRRGEREENLSRCPAPVTRDGRCAWKRSRLFCR